MNRKTTVIAEIGENHMGDWELARRMVKAAAQAGADVVKFQSYLGSDVADNDPEKEWFSQVQLPDKMHLELAHLAQTQGIAFLSSPFTVERARFLHDVVGLHAVKIASSEMLNEPLLRMVNESFETVYLSTGMATLEEVRQAVGWLPSVKRLVILHCVTQYPLKDEDANLRALKVLHQAFPHQEIGYSDHTVGLVAPVVAVALGATVIEKHFTLDKSLPGTDHILSISPDELKTLITTIRQTERLLGQAQKEPIEAERIIRQMVRERFTKEKQPA